jgi:hypothetical protein
MRIGYDQIEHNLGLVRNGGTGGKLTTIVSPSQDSC